MRQRLPPGEEQHDPGADHSDPGHLPHTRNLAQKQRRDADGEKRGEVAQRSRQVRPDQPVRGEGQQRHRDREEQAGGSEQGEAARMPLRIADRQRRQHQEHQRRHRHADPRPVHRRDGAQPELGQHERQRKTEGGTEGKGEQDRVHGGAGYDTACRDGMGCCGMRRLPIDQMHGQLLNRRSAIWMSKVFHADTRCYP